MKLISTIAAVLLLASCVSTAPISVAWRSNSSLQTATTDGTTTNTANDPAVNADKTTENQAAVNTSSGSATTAEQKQNAEDDKSEPVEVDKKESTEANN